jgi:hypothetical protein
VRVELTVVDLHLFVAQTSSDQSNVVGPLDILLLFGNLPAKHVIVFGFLLQRMRQDGVHILCIQCSLVGGFLVLPLVLLSFILDAFSLQLHLEHLFVVFKVDGLVVCQFFFHQFLARA